MEDSTDVEYGTLTPTFVGIVQLTVIRYRTHLPRIESQVLFDKIYLEHLFNVLYEFRTGLFNKLHPIDISHFCLALGIKLTKQEIARYMNPLRAMFFDFKIRDQLVQRGWGMTIFGHFMRRLLKSLKYPEQILTQRNGKERMLCHFVLTHPESNKLDGRQSGTDCQNPDERKILDKDASVARRYLESLSVETRTIWESHRLGCQVRMLILQLPRLHPHALLSIDHPQEDGDLRFMNLHSGTLLLKTPSIESIQRGPGEADEQPFHKVFFKNCLTFLTQLEDENFRALVPVFPCCKCEGENRLNPCDCQCHSYQQIEPSMEERGQL